MATEAEIVRRIKETKAALARLGDLRPGSLSEQYNTCGNPRCACKADPPHKHGPYYQLSYTRKGRSRTELVRPEHLAQVQAQVRNYHTLQALLDQLVEASIELDRVRRGGGRRGTAVSNRA